MTYSPRFPVFRIGLGHAEILLLAIGKCNMSNRKEKTIAKETSVSDGESR